MNDLISRRAAIDAISCDIIVIGEENAETVAKTIGMFVDRIKALPSADVPDTNVGEWERIPYSFTNGFRCSCCGTKSREKYWNFCPNCGAKMKGARDE